MKHYNPILHGSPRAFVEQSRKFKGGGGSSTSQTGIDPILKPYITYGLTEAQKLYETATPQYYGGQTYVSPSAATTQALQAAQNRAMAGNPLLTQAQANISNLQTASNAANPLYNQLYTNAGTNPALAANVYSSLASGQMANAANPQYRALYNNANVTPSQASDVYSALAGGKMGNAAQALNTASASGAYLGSNPYFNQALGGASQAAQQSYYDAIKQAQGGAAVAGRYGSNVSADLQNRAATTLSNTLANKYGELAYQNYANERALQEAAMGRLGTTSAQDIANRLAGAQALQGAGQQTFANRLAATQGLQSTSAQDIANRLAGAQNLTQAGQQEYANRLAAAGGLAGTSAADLSRQLAAGQAAPALAEADYQDINKLLQVGQAREDYAKTALQADIDRFNFEQNKPYAKLQTFLSSVYGAPMGSVSTTQQSGGKIVCTAMNHVYGFGSFRQAIWLKHSANMHPAYERGYHAIFLPFVMFAYKKDNNPFRKVCRKVAEHIARHRTADIWKQMRGGKRDTLGRIYRAVLEPVCYLAGKVKGD